MQPPTDQGTPATSTGNFVAAVVPSPSTGALEVTAEAGKWTDKDTAQQLEQPNALGIVRGLHSTASCPRETGHIFTNSVTLFHVMCLRKKRDESRTQTPIENRQYGHSRVCGCCHCANVVASIQLDVTDPMGITSLEL